MNILAYGLNYAPEIVGIGKYTSELCEWLAGRGHTVKVVTAFPYYPQWRIAPPYRGRRSLREWRAGVEVVRCPLFVPARPTGARRLLHHLSFAATSALAAVALARRLRPHVVFAVAPSLLSAPAAALAARLSGARAWLHVQDFEIDSAFQLGLLSGDLLRGCGRAAEGVILRRFDRVSSISPRMTERLAERKVERIVELRNWVDTAAIRPLAGAGRFRAELGFSASHVIALYSGTMAAKQGLEHIGAAARRLAEHRPDIGFVLCGEGPMRAELIASVGSLPTVRFLDLQPAERLNELLAMADIHLLPQRAGVADLVLPSKLPAMLASGRPVVAMAAAGTQLAAEIAGAGLAVPPEDGQALTEAIVRLADDTALRSALGEAARAAALARWDKRAILERFEHELAALARCARHGVAAVPGSA